MWNFATTGMVRADTVIAETMYAMPLTVASFARSPVSAEIAGMSEFIGMSIVTKVTP